MKVDCKKCFWYRGDDYDFRREFCKPRTELNKFETKYGTIGHNLRCCKHTNLNGNCKFFTEKTAYGFPGLVYNFIAVNLFKITLCFLLLISVVFFILKVF
jgi:hypothetical protein